MTAGVWPETDDGQALVPDSVFRSAGASLPHVAYRRDPIGWARDKMGVPESTIRWSLNPGYELHQWDGDADPLAKLFEAVADEKDAGCESGTGTGKSFGMALLILWFLACWENARAFTFAPKEDQLRLFIWMEVFKLWPRFRTHFPAAELTDLCIRMRGGTDDSWGARGYAVGVRAGEDVATKAAGMHARDMLLVYEETPGIPKAVMAAGENTSTAPHNIRVAIGNPNHQLDTLHQFCKEPDVVHVRMSALDHPNLVTGNAETIPGAVSLKSVDRRLRRYGEESPVYQSRVRGVSPEQAADSLVRLEWLKASAARYAARKAAGTLPERLTGKGVDVANSEHGDLAAVADFYERFVPKVRAFPCPDANKLGRDVNKDLDAARDLALQREWSLLPSHRTAVDGIGVGAGTVNELGRLGRVVFNFMSSKAAMKMIEKAQDGGDKEWSPDVNLFKNLRSQAYWQFRLDLQAGALDIEADEELWAELVAHTFEDEPQTIVLPKDDVKAILGRSPNKADAIVMGNWVRERVFVSSRPDEEPSTGYDFAKQRPRTRETGEEALAKMLSFGRPVSARAGRYHVPTRRSA